MQLLQITEAKVDSIKTLAGTDVKEVLSGNLTTADISAITQQLIDGSISVGGVLIKALLVFVIGRYIMKVILKLVDKMLSARKVERSIASFVRSLVNILLTILLVITVVGTLGVETTSFAALLASAGVAVGMALSGNLQNFAGGLVILLFKPYRAKDYVEFQGVSGTVEEVQIFHTIIKTVDNKRIFVPNGAASSGVITNYSKENMRRVDWTFGVEYGTDFAKVDATLREIIATDKRIVTEGDFAPFIALSELADSSVNFVVRCWVRNADYWGVYFDMNKNVYGTFNERGIGFPFPQLTVHQAND